MAARRTHVPKFGNWDVNDHMPYTVVFDQARDGRGGRSINPNDPAENPGMFSAGKGGGGAPAPKRHFNPNEPEESMETADQHPQQENSQHQERFKQERYQQQGIARDGSGSGSGSGGSRAGGQPQQRPHQVAAGAEERRRISTGQANLPSRGPSSDLSKRTSRDNGLERNVESPSTSFSADQSPAHPSGPSGARFEGSAGGRGSGTRLGGNSPAWDPTRRKSTGEEGQMFAPATPNRSRLRNGTNTREDPPTKGPSAALPKFGAWDAQDPGSGDGFTVIFNNARNERKTGGPVSLNARTPDKDNDLYDSSSPMGYQKKHSGQNSWLCCCTPRVNA